MCQILYILFFIPAFVTEWQYKHTLSSGDIFFLPVEESKRMDPKKLEQTVKRFTSLVDIEYDLQGYQKSFLNQVVEKLLKELDEWPPKTVAMIRNYNLLSFLYMYLGNFEDAETFADKAFAIDCNNIIVLTNRAWLYLRRQENYQAIDNIFKTLNSVQTKENVICAKAELAYAYSRFGIQLFNKAIDQFSSLLKEAERIRPETAEWRANVVLWKFGLVLTKQRFLNVYNLPDSKSINISKQQYQEVVSLLMEVINTKGTSEKEVIRTCRARSLVLIGILVTSADKSKNVFPNGARELFVPQLKYSPKAEDYANPAVEMFPKDSFILEKCGKIYRYLKQPHLAITYLKRAIQLKDSSFAHHHMALCLKTVVELNHGYHGNRSKQYSRRPRSDSAAFQSPSYQRSSYARRIPHASDYRHTSDVRRISKDLFGRRNSTLDSGFGSFASTTSDTGQSDCMFDITEQLQELTMTDQNTNLKKTSATNKSRMLNESKLNCLQRQNDLLSVIKSPKKITRPLNGERFDRDIKAIFYHLGKSFEIGSNHSAKYDEALLLRQLDRTDEALKSFKIILLNRNRCSLMILANAYEQAAFCLLEKTKVSKDPKTISEMEYDATVYLKQSVELSCVIASKIPMLKDCWEGASTLKELIEGKPVTKGNLQDMAFLCEKLGNLKHAIKCLEHIHTEYDKDDPETVDQLSDLYIKNGQFNDAILTFDLIKCLPNGLELLDVKKYASVCIEGALDALKRGEHCMSMIRLKKALEVVAPENYDVQTIDVNEEKGTDVYILCEEKVSDKWRYLADLLRETGLTISFNTDDISAGVPVLSGVNTLIKHSKNFIIIVEEMASVLEFYVCMVIQMKGKKVAIRGSADTCTKIPSSLHGLPHITIDIEQILHEDRWSNPYVTECVKTILTQIITPV